MDQQKLILRLLTIMSAAYVEITDNMNGDEEEVPVTLLRHLHGDFSGDRIPYPSYLPKARADLKKLNTKMMPSRQMTLIHDYLILLRDISTRPDLTKALVDASDIISNIIPVLRAREDFALQGKKQDLDLQFFDLDCPVSL